MDRGNEERKVRQGLRISETRRKTPSLSKQETIHTHTHRLETLSHFYTDGNNFFFVTEFFRDGIASVGIPKSDYFCLYTMYTSTSRNKVWSRTRKKENISVRENDEGRTKQSRRGTRVGRSIGSSTF